MIYNNFYSPNLRSYFSKEKLIILFKLAVKIIIILN